MLKKGSRGVQNVAGIGQVAAVSVKSPGQGEWVSAVNKFGAMWEVNNMPGAGPYNLKVITANGETVRTFSGLLAFAGP